jgi:hypothetical protein
MKNLTAAHVLALLAVVLPAIVAALQEHFPAGSTGALVVTLLGGVSLLLQRSALPSVNTKAAIEHAAIQAAPVATADALSTLTKDVSK